MNSITSGASAASGTCAKNDQRNQPYTMQIVKPTGEGVTRTTALLSLFQSDNGGAVIRKQRNRHRLMWLLPHRTEIGELSVHVSSKMVK